MRPLIYSVQWFYCTLLSGLGLLLLLLLRSQSGILSLEESVATPPKPLHWAPPPQYIWPEMAEEAHARWRPTQFACCGGAFGDCRGLAEHGLPLIGGKQTLYPHLMEVVWWIQQRCSGATIVRGHICYRHFLGLQQRKIAAPLAHVVGAAVVLGGVETAQIVTTLNHYYQQQETATMGLLCRHGRGWRNKELHVQEHAEGVLIRLHYDSASQSTINPTVQQAIRSYIKE